MLSVWWDVRGITHWELLPNECNIAADLYCQQLGSLAAKLQGKQDKVYFLHDNARPHVAKSTREKLLKLGWITFPRPPYSPGLAPTDYRLYHSLLDYLCEKYSTMRTASKWSWLSFFGQKSRDFYERGILSLPERWRQVVDSNGAYIVES